MPITLKFDTVPELDHFLELIAMPKTIEEFVTDVKENLAKFAAVNADEHAQVMAAFDALKAQVVSTVPDDVLAEVDQAFEAARTGIAGIFTPDEPAPAPDPTPAPTPDPTPAPPV